MDTQTPWCNFTPTPARRPWALSCCNDDLDKAASTPWHTIVISSMWCNKITVQLIVKCWPSLSCYVTGNQTCMLGHSSSIPTLNRLHISLCSLTCHQNSYDGRSTCPTTSHGTAFSTPKGVKMLYQTACHGEHTCLLFAWTDWCI